MKALLTTALAHLTSLAEAAGPPKVEVGNGLRHVFLKRSGYEPAQIDLRCPAKDHTVGDVVSLCDYLGRHGDPGRTTIFCTDKKFIAVIDDNTGEDGQADRDRITFLPEHSDRFKDWQGALRQGVFTHIEFRHWLEDHKNDVVERSMIAAVKGFAVNQSLDYSADLNQGETITLKSTTQRGEKTENGIVELAREFSIKLPLLVGWEKEYTIVLGVEADLVSQRVRFKIRAKNLTEVMHEMLNDQIAHLRKTLNGEGEDAESWLVVRGEPALDDEPTLFTGSARR